MQENPVAERPKAARKRLQRPQRVKPLIHDVLTLGGRGRRRRERSKSTSEDGSTNSTRSCGRRRGGFVREELISAPDLIPRLQRANNQLAKSLFVDRLEPPVLSWGPAHRDSTATSRNRWRRFRASSLVFDEQTVDVLFDREVLGGKTPTCNGHSPSR